MVFLTSVSKLGFTVDVEKFVMRVFEAKSIGVALEVNVGHGFKSRTRFDGGGNRRVFVAAMNLDCELCPGLEGALNFLALVRTQWEVHGFWHPGRNDPIILDLARLKKEITKDSSGVLLK